MKKLLIINLVLIIVCMVLLFFSAQKNYKEISSLNENSKADSYQLIWPGILPDNKLYKLKVLRDKITAKMILNPVDKVKFDLLMADKTIYASKILVNKGEISLAKETALKGENYYSILVQDYNKALLKNNIIPKELDKQISLAALKHQEVLKEIVMRVKDEDKTSFEAAENFSHINYHFIEGLRSPKSK